MLDNDLNIFYSGGSGGFYLLHWILLYKKHYANFSSDNELKVKFISQLTNEHRSQLRLSRDSYQNIKDPKWPHYKYYFNNFDSLSPPMKLELQQHHSNWADPTNLDGWLDYQLDCIIQHQWNNSAGWKSTEQWPENSVTLSTGCPQRKYKIYFFCNDVDQWKNYPGKRIVLYTDIFSQLRLGAFKHANWFRNTTLNTKQIIKEILKNNITKINNEYIHADLVSAFNSADLVIKLQDLITDPTGTLGIAPTDDHIKFRNHWKSLHPTQLLEKCKL
jgi:hypothetical protein